MERKIARKSLNGDGEHGSRNSDDIDEEDLHKNSHWKVGMSHNWIETFFAVFTAIYFLIVYLMYAYTWDKSASLKYLGWTIVLTLLPFYRVRKIVTQKCKYRKFLNIFTIHSSPIRIALSSLALLVPIVFLESYLGEQNLLVLYFSLTILFRLVDSRSLYDCTALCIVYSVDFQGLPNLYGRIWFTTTRILLWVSLFLGVLCGSVLRRSTFRIWEHIRLLIIFRKKSKQERVFSNFIASAHFSPDLLDAAIKRRDISPESQKRQEKSPYGDLESPYEPSIVYSTAIAESASEAGILFSFNLKPILSLEKIKSLDGLERKLATVIAFKLVVSDDRECCMNSQAGHMMHDLLDMLATRQKISCVRKFGDTWVGCIGLHRGWENNRKDSYHAILMGCEAMVLAKRMQLQLCCAVESGKIDAGFVGCSNYDVFGPEIRWVLNMVEAKKHGHVLVGNSARNLNTRQKTFDPETAISVHFGRTVIDSIWKTKQECEKVHSVYKLSDLVTDEESLIQDFLDADNAAIKKVTDIPTMSWQAVQSILDGSDRPNLNSKPAPERTWDEEIACELQMSVEERFGMSLNDAALQGMSEDDLEELHVEIETSIRSLMVEHFFGSFFRLLILLSPAKYRHGVNDQVVPASSLNLSDESQEFLSPVENILSGIPFTRSWFAPENKAKQKRFEDTDVSLREKIKKEAVSHLIVATGSSKSVGITSARDSIKSIARCHARSNNPTNRLPNLPLSTGLSRRNIGSVHPCLFTSEMDSSQHLYGGECKYEYDENIKLGPRVSTRTLFSGEYSNQSNQDVTLSSSISRFVQYKPQGSVRSKYMPAPSILKQRSFAGTLKGSSKYNEAEEFPVKIDLPGRGLEKYTSDARSISNAYVGVCFCLLALYAVLLCIVDRSYMYQIGAVKPSYIFGFLALNFLFLNLTERKYDRIVCVVLFVLRCLMIVAVMPYLAGDSNVFTEGNNIKYLQGNTLLVLGLWFPIALRQSFLFNCLELVLHILGAAYVRNITHVAQHRTLRVATARMVPIIVFFLLIFWAIEYLCILSYVIENILVPEAQTLYQREYVHAREMLHACSPNIPLDKRQLYCPRRYRSCSVLAIHVKAADVLPGLVDALSVASFMKEIMLLMDGCVKECGLLKVTHFSGIFIAACPDIIDDNTPINYMTRTVMCLRKIQTKLDAFSRRNSVNVSIGAGLSCGSVTMGLLGNTRFCFDVSGAARDLAIFMASHQNDGIFALESFGPHFRDGQLSDDLVVREVTVTAGHKTMKWLQLDGAFNKGMQLDDFEYMCMLGRGGFGSVHLLWENATEKEYAIKAIPRKRGSAIPKMIQREFIILQQIQHANVVSFKCCIINKAMIYLVMSYVRGGNLKQIVERNKPDLKHLTLWFAELVLALNYIHSLGIIHRDVKPANCMIDASGHLKLADFGLSKIVSPTASSGFDPTGSVGEEDYRNASATVAINLIKSILPLKSNMSEGEVHLPERSVQILLIDFNLMSSSAKRLKEMYFKVTSVSSSAEAQEAIAQATFKAEIILVDLDSVNMSDPTSTMSCGLALLQDLALKSKNIPIIGLSSIDDRDLRRKIISAGAREVLPLPIHKASRDTLLKYGRLYHHLNKPQRSKSFHMIPPIAIEKEPEDSKDEDTNQGIALNSTLGAEDTAERTARDEEHEGGLTSAVLPSSLVGNTSCYSHATSGTERMDTPNTMNDPKAQVWSAHTAAKRVVSEGQQKHSAVGTIHFMAPEVIFEHKYGRSVDWWACGVTFYECTVRQHLFSGLEKEVIMQQILSGPIDLEPLSQYSSLLQSLVAGLLVRNPNLRLGTEGAHTIMRQDFFRGIDWNTISDSVPNYKPAQHVNQRHSIEDKMLFYGEVHDKKTEHDRRVDSTLEDYRRAALAKEGRGAPGASASRSKKRHCKNLNMRQRKEDFQKLTDKRKSWVSGNHLLSEINGGKKVAPFNAAQQGKQASQRGTMYNNPSAPGAGIGRSGIMNSSLDWSITMLPEGDSEEGKVDGDDEDDDEQKQSDSKEVQDLDDSVSACASAEYEAHASDDDQDESESQAGPTVTATAADGDGDGDADADGESESQCQSPLEVECPTPPEGVCGVEGDTDTDAVVEGVGESESPAEGVDSQAKEEGRSTLL